jgi:hypothetical protein
MDLSQKEFWPLSIQPFFESEFGSNVSFYLYSKYPHNKLDKVKFEFQTDMYGLEIEKNVSIPSKRFAFVSRVDLHLRVKSNKINISKLIKLRISFLIKHCPCPWDSLTSNKESCCSSSSEKLTTSEVNYYVLIPLVARPSKENIFLLDNFHNLVFPRDSRPVKDHLTTTWDKLPLDFLSLPKIGPFLLKTNAFSTQNFDYKGDSLYTNLVHFFEKLASFGIFIEVLNQPYHLIGIVRKAL